MVSIACTHLSKLSCLMSLYWLITISSQSLVRNSGLVGMKFSITLCCVITRTGKYVSLLTGSSFTNSVITVVLISTGDVCMTSGVFLTCSGAVW